MKEKTYKNKLEEMKKKHEKRIRTWDREWSDMLLSLNGSLVFLQSRLDSTPSGCLVETGLSLPKRDEVITRTEMGLTVIHKKERIKSPSLFTLGNSSSNYFSKDSPLRTCLRRTCLNNNKEHSKVIFFIALFRNSVTVSMHTVCASRHRRYIKKISQLFYIVSFVTCKWVYNWWLVMSRRF